ncbi:hypothetical protein KOR34_52820 [Posidoniimonas corsicana]|uniref:DUF1573 domain-containing protein n=1 Tax=Posidoniimonas corsicana TaxID=1938618 RepID=A0A5C5UU87_9BACT|nr:DUF1573 domain-containing protein [Posidoniimonas corsicana]TWT29227.1 hypothetical protein KOR34_52820 [Posidoniimonas corsicana]
MPCVSLRPAPRATALKIACLGVLLLTGCVGESADGPTAKTPHTNEAVSTTALKPVRSGPASNGVGSERRPKLVAAATTHEFGGMSIREVRSHAFTLRNEGDAPLQISNAAANCKCLSHEFSRQTIPPGEEATLTLTWRGGEEPRERLTARVNVETNDPDQPVVQFSAVGSVGAELDVAPAQLHAQEVAPGEPLTLSTVVTSPVWKQIYLVDIASPSDKLRVTTTPLSPAECVSIGCRSGCRVEVTANADLTTGPYSNYLELSAQPASDPGAAAPRRLRIPIGWAPRQSIAVSGPGVDEAGVIHLGRIDKGAHTKRYLVKVTDELPELVVTDQRVSPDFLGVQLEPYRKGELGWLYRMELSIPEHARATKYGKDGVVQFTFDHPRIKELRVELDLGVGI